MSFDVLGIIAPHPPIMVPAVGGSRATVTEASAQALRQAAGLLERFAPETLVIMSPHSPGFGDAFVVSTEERRAGDLGQFDAPSARRDTPGDPELAAAILCEAGDTGIPAVSREELGGFGTRALDHGVLVPLSFLDPEGRYPTLDLAFTMMPAEVHAAFGHVVRRAAESLGRRIAFVASGDCAHRLTRDAPAGYSPRATEFDALLVRLIGAGDFAGLAAVDTGLREAAGECGWRSFLTLGGYLEGTDARPRVLAYEGPWGVGYLSAVFAPADVLAELPGGTVTPASGSKGGMKGDEESAVVRLARLTVEQVVRHGTVPAAEPLTDPGLPARAGAFVTLHSGGQLRGCIGTIAPTQSTLAEEIVHNAVSAATQDPRFQQVAEHELDGLEIKVDVLHAPEPVSALDELDPRVYGCIVSCSGRRGLLLPDLEGVDTCEEQVSIAMRKGGIRPGEAISLERFKVDRYA